MFRDQPATLVDLASAPKGWEELGAALDHPPANVRAPKGHRDRYTRARREWVRAADRELIDHCGYTFLKRAKSGPLISWPPR